MNKVVVTFLPDDKKVVVEKGTNLLSAALSAHIHLNSSCGGDGVCGKCRVFVKTGAVHAEPSGRIRPEERRIGAHLACQTLVESDCVVEIPPESRLDMSVLSKEELALRLRGIYAPSEDVQEAARPVREDFAFQPLVEKFYIQLPAPDFNDKLSDLERVERAVQEKIGDVPLHTGLANLRRLGELLRTSSWNVTVTVAAKGPAFEILAIEPQDTSEKNFGLVFDIGTTTITGQLVDLKKKEILGTKATYNRQATFGSDIITRIIYAQAPDGLEKLHHAVVDVLNEMTEALTDECRVDLNDVTCACVAGNTTMIHLLLRIDPSHIRKEPYVPTANFISGLKAAEAGLKINPHGALYCVPGVSSYVGGDISAGVLSCGLFRSADLQLLIDIGTNGEIVLGNAEWLISCAASAGPAFEGSGMKSGLRAVKGAIQGVSVDRKSLDVTYTTIGGDTPRGLCGSGYIDLVTQLLGAGVVDKNGKLNRNKTSKRLRPGDAGYEFVVVFADEKGLAEDIVLTDADLDNFKRAKAAIYSAVSLLIRHMGLSVQDIRNIFIAGGFGTSLNVESAVATGLIPDLPRDKYVFVGNSSLAGAREYLFSRRAAGACDKIAANITYFELSTDAAYMDEYMAALFFPHTDMTRFPSVKYEKDEGPVTPSALKPRPCL
ncbi:MAG: ASKHA domain-containing protein [Candidatus Omnitrophica bacterium]|nr:ASKHA domain-containing protein [Candidatus Omnitrophota bacterium]